MSNKKMFRQGDVLVVECSDKEASVASEDVKLDNGRIVLAYGEVTGHAHAIRPTKTSPAVLKQAKDLTRFLIVEAKKGVELRHEEHSTILIPPGSYKVIRQREYRPERNIMVAD